MVVLVLSAGVRVVRLGSPAEYMFDEVYYAKDAKAILDGRMDPRKDYHWEPGDVTSWAHPDAGKLAIAVGIVLFGDNATGWRSMPALAGLALLALVYPLARRLGLSPGWGFVALLFAAADLLGIVQSRIATLDVFVALWTVLCVYLALRYVQDGWRTRWLMLAGLSAGLALATKWSGLLAVVGGRARRPAASIQEVDRLGAGERRRARAEWPRRVALLLAAFVGLPVALYMASYLPYFLDGHPWRDFVELHRQMWHFNLTLSAPHSYASRAPTWILDQRPVWYYFEGDGDYPRRRRHGQPFLWWLALGAVVAAPFVALRRGTVERRIPVLAALLVAVLYLPWFATSRTSFLYYMTPVAPFFAIVVAAMLQWVSRSAVDGGERRESLSPRASSGPGLMRLILPAVLAAAVTAFAWYPLSRLAATLFWEYPAAVSKGLAFTVSGLAITAGVVLVVTLFWRRSLRLVAVSLLVGTIVGICLPFLPIALDIAISSERFYRLMWFRSWI